MSPAYADFRQSPNVEDRRGETIRDVADLPGMFSQLANTATNKGRDIMDLFSSPPEPDAMSRALGFDDIMTTQAPLADTVPPAPTRDDLAAAVSAPNNGFSRYSDEGYGTSWPVSPITPSPEHIRTMEEVKPPEPQAA